MVSQSWIWLHSFTFVSDFDDLDTIMHAANVFACSCEYRMFVHYSTKHVIVHTSFYCIRLQTKLINSDFSQSSHQFDNTIQEILHIHLYFYNINLQPCTIPLPSSSPSHRHHMHLHFLLIKHTPRSINPLPSSNHFRFEILDCILLWWTMILKSSNGIK